jgi:DNA invertase Pin-like site-specific DNA recombinase
MTQRKLRCAIYTRKSTEEGLDQAFNSLDAQREACAAYVLSQSGEGWIALPGRYDDGGFSGGNMERPALQKLLDEIDRGGVDVVVVYKIDRLTRSLADFAKIVERFEKRNVSFVSVTQAFNTTSSMGRLTLNVLLSFAQFEREVTAERIRDKFSASRKKGIFMGGNPPLGYDPKDRKLVVNEPEAETVRLIFQRYLELGSVSLLRAELDSKGIQPKAWVSTSGRGMGGGRWYIGPLRHILRNRVYIGEAVHKGTSYPGEHEAIIAKDLFDAVQAKLESNRASHHRNRTIGSDALLIGLIFDDNGNAMSPSKSRRTGGKFYLYYVSRARLQRQDPNAMRPVPAEIIEHLVRDRILRLAAKDERSAKDKRANAASNGQPFSEPNDASLRELIRELVVRVDVSLTKTSITLNHAAVAACVGVPIRQLTKALRDRLPKGDEIATSDGDAAITIPLRLPLRGGAKRIEGWDRQDWSVAKPRHDRVLIKALSRAHEWREWIERGEISNIEALAKRVGQERRHAHAHLKLAFLAPDIQRDILMGRQPVTLTLSALIDAELPLAWADQRTLLRTVTPTFVQSGG